MPEITALSDWELTNRLRKARGQKPLPDPHKKRSAPPSKMRGSAADFIVIDDPAGAVSTPHITVSGFEPSVWSSGSLSAGDITTTSIVAAGTTTTAVHPDHAAGSLWANGDSGGTLLYTDSSGLTHEVTAGGGGHICTKCGTDESP